jgi:hypothetical protein
LEAILSILVLKKGDQNISKDKFYKQEPKVEGRKTKVLPIANYFLYQCIPILINTNSVLLESYCLPNIVNTSDNVSYNYYYLRDNSSKRGSRFQ